MIRNLSVLALAAAFSIQAFAGAPARVKTSGAEKVRKAIDDICGDTWCEGDFQFKFNTVSFDKKSLQTTVNFTMTPYIDAQNVTDTETSAATVLNTNYSVQCVIKGYADAALIVKSNGSLDETFYTSFSDCVNSLESALISRI
jgi:hypothetical protein